MEAALEELGDDTDAAIAQALKAQIAELNVRVANAIRKAGGTAFEAGQIGPDTHLYLGYAKVVLDADKNLIDAHLDEYFLPAGRLRTALASGATKYTLNDNPYSNPWHPAVSAAQAAVAGKTTVDLANAAIETIAGGTGKGFFIQIGAAKFQLKFVAAADVTAVHTTADEVKGTDWADTILGALRFVCTTAGDGFAVGDVLNDQVVADNISWYVGAINAGSVHILDNTGSAVAVDPIQVGEKPAGADAPTVAPVFTDGALSKRDANSIYQSTNTGSRGRNLWGHPFNIAMGYLEAHLLVTNGTSTQYDGWLGYGQIFSTKLIDATTAVTFQYSKSYLEVATDLIDYLRSPYTTTYVEVTTQGTPETTNTRGVCPELTVVFEVATNKIVKITYTHNNVENNFGTAHNPTTAPSGSTPTDYEAMWKAGYATFLASLQGKTVSTILALDLSASSRDNADDYLTTKGINVIAGVTATSANAISTLRAACQLYFDGEATASTYTPPAA